ncbi:MAG TPA: TIGR01777 family oxidoreductase [Longimicrobiaceae bacterium]|nr:TIGR01777 family oxidoreductase [Longimicrobiaceae bacterium]
MTIPEPNSATMTPLRIAVTGSHGMVGSALVEALKGSGYEVIRVVRSPPGSGSADIYWNPSDAEIDGQAFNGLDGVVNLAGENINQRWTSTAKQRIRRSRVDGTELLAGALAALDSPPRVLVNASAVGFYGDRGDEHLTEGSGVGSGFLATVVRDWEKATAPAARAGIRVVMTRSGVVLSEQGGALKKMLPAFRMGVGGTMGSGEQWMSWVSLADEVAGIRFALESTDLRGPVNLTSPQPVTNAEFTRTLGRVLDRPAFFRVPRVALEIAFGQMAEETILASQHAVSDRLVQAGFEFRYPQLEQALQAAL